VFLCASFVPFVVKKTLSDFLTNISVLYAFYSLTICSNFTADYKTKPDFLRLEITLKYLFYE